MILSVMILFQEILYLFDISAGDATTNARPQTTAPDSVCFLCS